MPDKPVACPFTVIVDTREQLPYGFDNIEVGGQRLIVPTDFQTLQTGDYSIRGMENLVTIERKSVGDFYGSITSGRSRLEAEFQRMEAMQFSAIIVEGRLESVLESMLHGRRITSQAVRATVASWSVKYKTRWLFVASRVYGELMTFELLEKFYRYETQRRQEPGCVHIKEVIQEIKKAHGDESWANPSVENGG